MKNRKHTYLFGLFVLVGLLISSCQKDESALHDYDLFGRLQSKGGTWKVVQTETFQNDIENPTVTTTTPTEEINYHFYLRSLEVFGVLVDVATVSIYTGENLTGIFDCEAEKERVVFRDGQVFGGTVYTVEKNKPNKQVWNYTVGNSTTRITLERSDFSVPHLGTVEGGG